jgi:hypothetical protein
VSRDDETETEQGEEADSDSKSPFLLFLHLMGLCHEMLKQTEQGGGR